MTDAEFQELIDAAKTRLALNIEESFNKAKADTHASFQECLVNLNARFDQAAKDLGVNLDKPAASSNAPVPPRPEPEQYLTEFCP